MGTSAAPDPLTGNHPLIPRWVPNETPTGDGTVAGSDGNATPEPQSGDAPVVNMGTVFRMPRSTLTSAIRISSTGGAGSGGRRRSGGRRSRRTAPSAGGRVRKAVSQYISARGGPASVARRLGVAVDVGARLYQVLDRIARQGLETALREFGTEINERSAGAVADALITLVCEEAAPNIGGVLDESLARAACDETLIALYQQGLTLTTLTPEQIPAVIQAFAVNAACLLIAREIGTELVDRPRTESETRDLQAILHSVVESSMRMNLPAGDVSNHTIRDVRTAVRDAYQDAFQILRAGR